MAQGASVCSKDAVLQRWGREGVAGELQSCGRLVAGLARPGLYIPTWPAGMERITPSFHEDGR